MTSSGGNGGDLYSDDQRNNVTSGGNETVSSPASLAVLSDQEDVRMDEKLAALKKSTSENQKLLKETIKLARKSQSSLEINRRLYLVYLQAEDQKLVEEVVTQTKKTNTALAMQRELYKKILEAIKSTRRSSRKANFSDTKVNSGEKRLLEQEENSAMESKKTQKLKSEEDWTDVPITFKHT